MSEQSKEDKANIAAMLGVLGLVAWIIPIVGVPVAITGLVYAFKANDSAKAGIAMALCIISLVASGINAYIGAQRGYEAGKAIENSYYDY